MSFVPLQPSALRLGLYIKIEGSWFSHPFPTNSFKIKTEKELETLQALSKVKLFVDPDRSDPEGSTPDLEDTLDCSPRPEPIQPKDPSEKPDDSFSLSPPKSENPEPIQDDPILRKVAQHEAFQAYQEHLQSVGCQFQEVVQGGKQVMQDIVTGRPRGLRNAQKIVSNLCDILGEADHSRALLNLMGNHESQDEFFLHALNVCSLSLMVGQDLGFHREENEKLALGALFHDVGELKFPAEKLLQKGYMSPGELRIFLTTHPTYGVELVEKIPNFPFEAVEVIQQHHERLNGTGLPAGKKDESISDFAKIVMVVDAYDELIHHPDPARALIPSEALSYLYVKCRKTLWNEAVISLIRQLGVYPPGSLVHLSNEKIGLVTSVNFEARLRPIILVHDEHTSTDEPIVLNLAQEDESLTIVEAIRPIDLSPKIRECLNPRQIISYFPSSSPCETGVLSSASLSSSSFQK